MPSEASAQGVTLPSDSAVGASLPGTTSSPTSTAMPAASAGMPVVILG